MLPIKKMARFGILAGALFGLAAPATYSQSTPASPSSRIDIADFKPTFEEEFDELDISEWGCLSRWIAHTPWSGDFGDAKFVAPGHGSPFSIQDGILSIEVRRNSDGQWESGMLSSWSRCNSGWAQKNGYFEIRTRLPSGSGFWPAFWLIGTDRSEGTIEVDIFEYYSHRPDKISLNIHKHQSPSGEPRRSRGKRHEVTPQILSEQFHTYGAQITEKEIIFYLNREEIWRTPAPAEFQQPMYLLVSLAAEEYRMDETTPDSAKMEIDYVRAYQRRPIGF